jgi:hypothetical protein
MLAIDRSQGHQRTLEEIADLEAENAKRLSAA